MRHVCITCDVIFTLLRHILRPLTKLRQILRQILRPLTKLFHFLTQNCCVLPVRDISDSFKVDVGDYGCLIYYYANFGGNLISSLAAYTERIHRQIEEYIYRDGNRYMSQHREYVWNNGVF